MPDILFKCGSCGMHLVVDDAVAGQTINCSECGSSVTIPAKQTAVSEVPTESQRDGDPCPRNSQTPSKLTTKTLLFLQGTKFGQAWCPQCKMSVEDIDRCPVCQSTIEIYGIWALRQKNIRNNVIVGGFLAIITVSITLVVLICSPDSYWVAMIIFAIGMVLAHSKYKLPDIDIKKVRNAPSASVKSGSAKNMTKNGVSIQPSGNADKFRFSIRAIIGITLMSIVANYLGIDNLGSLAVILFLAVFSGYALWKAIPLWRDSRGT